jgi:hypothetical protein
MRRMLRAAEQADGRGRRAASRVNGTGRPDSRRSLCYERRTQRIMMYRRRISTIRGLVDGELRLTSTATRGGRIQEGRTEGGGTRSGRPRVSYNTNDIQCLYVRAFADSISAAVAFRWVKNKLQLLDYSSVRLV